MHKIVITSLVVCSFMGSVLAKEKHHEDPTKIITKAGISYSEGVKLSGSLGLDDARKINGSINADGNEWRVGGSWLFPVGIMNFNFSRAEYEPEGYRNNYSIGTFIPLSYFDIAPMGWQIFPMAGYNYNDGEIAYFNDSNVENDYVMLPASSHGGYLGAFTLKPLTDKWTFMAFGGGSMGSDDYSGYWTGAGLSHKLTDAQSFNFYAVLAEDDYGENNRVGVSYTYEFK